MKSVTITLQDDGTYTVNDQPFQSAEEAMEAAMNMLRGPGATEEESAAAMASGYDKVAGNRAQPSSVGALFGEE